MFAIRVLHQSGIPACQCIIMPHDPACGSVMLGFGHKLRATVPAAWLTSQCSRTCFQVLEWFFCRNFIFVSNLTCLFTLQQVCKDIDYFHTFRGAVGCHLQVHPETSNQVWSSFSDYSSHYGWNAFQLSAQQVKHDALGSACMFCMCSH